MKISFNNDNRHTFIDKNTKTTESTNHYHTINHRFERSILRTFEEVTQVSSQDLGAIFFEAEARVEAPSIQHPSDTIGHHQSDPEDYSSIWRGICTEFDWRLLYDRACCFCFCGVSTWLSDHPISFRQRCSFLFEAFFPPSFLTQMLLQFSTIKADCTQAFHNS